MNTTQIATNHRVRLLNKLKNKKYRNAYAAAHTKTIVPFQIRILREQRGWSQAKLAKLAKTTQAAISRLEDPDYGNISISTLLKLSSCFDNALLVKFVPFSKLLSEYADKSADALMTKTFEEEIDIIQSWAESTPISTAHHITTVYVNIEWHIDSTLPQEYETIQVGPVPPRSRIVSQMVPHYFIGQTV